MTDFKNTQKISEIKFYKKIHNYCPIGKDWYTSNLEIEFTPNNIIPDYIKLENKINEIDEKELIIEDVVNYVYNEVKKYSKNLKVKCIVDDAKHFKVEVVKKN